VVFVLSAFRELELAMARQPGPLACWPLGAPIVQWVMALPAALDSARLPQATQLRARAKSWAAQELRALYMSDAPGSMA
jgi:hypothetical protein